ncbi:Sec-independent protein translocase TatB, partial [Sulfurimonas sp.]|nr:Sec-independent protein translocase TatB [Sulfurimonas sp.]
PDKLPGAMVDIAKFFRQMKKTVGSMKETLEEEINVSEIKQEALAYKKELLDAQDKLEEATDTSSITNKLTDLSDDIIGDIEDDSPKEKEVTFKKKKKKKEKEEDTDV